MTDIPIPNSIERRLLLHSSRERVWSALTEPDQIVKWFGTQVQYDSLAAGSAVVFEWDDNKVMGQFEAVDPPNKLAFRWAASEEYAEDTPFEQRLTTLVTYTLEEITIGTRLVMLETGFANLPTDVRRRSLGLNMRAWDVELREMDAYLKAESAG